ncbi:RNA polymerase factor sigma-54 [Bacteriovorax sp. PP10]|uniref:RNA polymerase factor sigma-54 n=1 Tax=Bacteriovorax antarcticus TaxID=3088717 RepID=A0ABU5VVI8_9BACT|nr:RNA polymerase factor sigma-54 [Bacteriovorax sp. PP10]MEA9357073.1 RNA polymerase factor sigma-54 [Bacteriovorax sp. PP10]
MAIKISQGLKQSQNLAMTPQLQQAIKLLTLTHLEMTNVIAEEMVENPMLEEAGVDTDVDSPTENDGEVREATSDDFSEAPLMKDKDDFDWDSYADSFNSNSSTSPNMAGGDSDEMPSYENIVSKGMTLAEHLEWQLKMETLSDDQWKLAQLIIGNINDDGYLDVNFEELIAESGIDRDEAFDILEIVQRLDPVGCGASNLQECLLAQARIAEERSPLLEKLIRDHLEDLQSKNFDKISKALSVSIDQVKQTSLLLQNFHPKPGRLVATPDTHYILPDIYVVEAGGEFVVQVNDEGIPRLKISKLYQEMIKKGAGHKTDEASEFVKDKLRAAEWLIKSIQNRQKTIEKVSKAIVAKQQEFFKKGPKHLKPMVLKDVANEIGMHESTVSRVTTNKYMHTPLGTFELKYFFNTGIGGKDGGVDIASEVLKLKIKAIFDGENPTKPLSDQKVVEILARENLTVARRTVTKYREMLGVAPSSKRKEKN